LLHSIALEGRQSLFPRTPFGGTLSLGGVRLNALPR
jgi:hypothetical protein